MMKLKYYMRNPISALLLLFVLSSAFITVGIFIYLVGYILAKGIPYLTPELFSFSYTSERSEERRVGIEC